LACIGKFRKERSFVPSRDPAFPPKDGEDPVVKHGIVHDRIGPGPELLENFPVKTEKHPGLRV